jgi:hypothetical protein
VWVGVGVVMGAPHLGACARCAVTVTRGHLRTSRHIYPEPLIEHACSTHSFAQPLLY